jgi:hypothetical protein
MRPLVEPIPAVATVCYRSRAAIIINLHPKHLYLTRGRKVFVFKGRLR